jgi:hypothetical protein
MNHLSKTIAFGCIALGLASGARASTVAAWTFETSQPATAGPFTPEIGAGTALGFHAGASTYSSPVGNGSAHSFSSNTFAVGDYYQFSVSTIGLNDIVLSWDQTSSSTGPRDFRLAYSTNGTTFTDFANYSVLANASPNPVWNSTTASVLYSFTQNLSSITALNNQAAVYFRLIDNSTIAANGGAVGTAGTDRVDNFNISGTSVVPLPAAVWLLGSGLLGLGGLTRRRSSI